MKDYHGEKAFVPVHQYASAGNIARGEIGSIDHFRFIEVPEMVHWDGEGAAVSNNSGFMESGGKYNVYPMLVVGSQSFTTIGFNTGGGNSGTKWQIHSRKPHSEGSITRDDPYGKTGMYSIQFWYGFMAIRPEWICLVKAVAQK